MTQSLTEQNEESSIIKTDISSLSSLDLFTLWVLTVESVCVDMQLVEQNQLETKCQSSDTNSDRAMPLFISHGIWFPRGNKRIEWDINRINENLIWHGGGSCDNICDSSLSLSIQQRQLFFKTMHETQLKFFHYFNKILKSKIETERSFWNFFNIFL